MPFPFDPNLRIFNTTSRFFFFSFAFSETFFSLLPHVGSGI